MRSRRLRHVGFGSWRQLELSCSLVTRMSELSCVLVAWSEPQQTADTSDLNAFRLPRSCACRSVGSHAFVCHRSQVSGSALTPVCSGGAIVVVQDDATCASTWPAPCTFQSCKNCPSGLVPSRDATRCMACGNSTIGAGSASECRCDDPGAILVEKDQVRSTRLDAWSRHSL